MNSNPKGDGEVRNSENYIFKISIIKTPIVYWNGAKADIRLMIEGDKK